MAKKSHKPVKRKAAIAKLPADALYATPGTPECLKLDVLQAHMHLLPRVETPVTNRFTPGLYLREIRVPAGTLVITKIHLTEHPFIVSQGTISVCDENEGVRRISAPYTGITKPGTRRLCYCHTDVVWTTCHATNETDVDKIEAQIIMPHDIDVEALNAGQSALLAEAINPVKQLLSDSTLTPQTT